MRDSHLLDATEPLPHTLLLHRRLETAYDGDSGIAHGPGEVVGLEDGVAGAAWEQKEGGNGPLSKLRSPFDFICDWISRLTIPRPPRLLTT